MKNLIYCFLLLVFNQSCSQSLDHENEISSVTYSANTRGSNYQCIIDKTSIRIESNEKGNERKLTSEEWFSVTAEAKEISLTDLANYEVITEKSSVDRVRIAKIKILANGKLYESNSFDEGTPPKELKDLIGIMLTLAKTVE